MNFNSYDAIVIVTDHDNLNYDKILKHSKLIIDTRGRFKNKNLRKFILYNEILYFVQARMSSERLPGKSLIKINSKPLIKHIYDRLKYFGRKKYLF